MNRIKLYYQVGNKLGLSQIEIKNILNGGAKKTNQAKLETGPPWYPGGFYGSISIKDF